MVETLRLVIEPGDMTGAVSRDSIERAAEILRAGGIVAFPTETVYGLGASALDESGVGRIFEAKGRPAWDPLIVHVCDRGMLRRVAVDIPGCAQPLMEAFWPGPLTLLLPRNELVPLAVTAGRLRVGVRMPAHPVALELIRRAGVPIAAPSANRFGHVSPTTAAHVLADLDGRIDAVLDGGETSFGLESTVLDACETPMVIYRLGAVTAAQIAAVCGPVIVYADQEKADRAKDGGALPAPGLGMRHYAPRARLLLIEGEGAGQQAAFVTAVREARGNGERVGLMLPQEFESGDDLWRGWAEGLVFRWGGWTNEEQLAHRLFAGLRELDAAGASVILCPLPQGSGLGAAIRDRLRKAAQ